MELLSWRDLLARGARAALRFRVAMRMAASPFTGGGGGGIGPTLGIVVWVEQKSVYAALVERNGVFYSRAVHVLMESVDRSVQVSHGPLAGIGRALARLSLAMEVDASRFPVIWCDHAGWYARALATCLPGQVSYPLVPTSNGACLLEASLPTMTINHMVSGNPWAATEVISSSDVMKQAQSTTLSGGMTLDAVVPYPAAVVAGIVASGSCPRRHHVVVWYEPGIVLAALVWKGLVVQSDVQHIESVDGATASICHALAESRVLQLISSMERSSRLIHKRITVTVLGVGISIPGHLVQEVCRVCKIRPGALVCREVSREGVVHEFGIPGAMAAAEWMSRRNGRWRSPEQE